MQPKSVRDALRIAQAMGRGEDTILAHINPREAKLLKKRGGSGKRNPLTGLVEFDDTEGGDPRGNEAQQADTSQPEGGKVSEAQVESGNQANAAAAAEAEAKTQSSSQVGGGANTPDTSKIENKTPEDTSLFGSAMKAINEMFGVSPAEAKPLADFTQSTPTTIQEAEKVQPPTVSQETLDQFAAEKAKDDARRAAGTAISATTGAPIPDLNNPTPAPSVDPLLDPVQKAIEDEQLTTPISDTVAAAKNIAKSTMGTTPTVDAQQIADNTAKNTAKSIQGADLPATYSPPGTVADASIPNPAITNNKYAAFTSEDPEEIARYNEAIGALGPKNALADMVLGQRVPDVTSKNPITNAVQGVADFLTDKFTPSYNLGSPQYNAISQNVDRVTGGGNLGLTGGGPDHPLLTTGATLGSATDTQTPYVMPPVVPNQPTPFTYAPTPTYQNYVYPTQSYNTGLNPALIPGYRYAGGGRIGENNALANALRMLMARNKT
jgi:hypothetical protein